MKIRVFPDTVLREKAKEARDTGAAAALSAALLSVMRQSRGCVGIAATQLGILSRIICVDVTGHKKAKESHGLLVMTNPVITDGSGEITVREGCLSVPDFTGNVTRNAAIKMSYMDMDGAKRQLETSGFEAVVIQHELDHLDGILFIDRITDVKRNLFKRINY